MPKDDAPITEFNYRDATRKNLPPAGSPPSECVAEQPKVKFAYDPHRSPALRFNERIVRCRELLEKATRTSLTNEEAAELAFHLESEQPWLEWAGKQESPEFEVEPVALHIHERVSAQAILRTVRREDVQRDFFAEPKLPAREARAYYQHDVDWANRLILGDSLQVMTSLARREGLAGKVQMIYLDPPYGIKFSSNWQNEVGKRDVKDKDEDLTREPEMIRAYRDTWTLGVHSYLAYLKQRLILARELLTDSGSIFVQISDENLHRVRAVMDEVFGAENAVGTIVFQKTGGFTQRFLPLVENYLLWYAKDSEKTKFRSLREFTQYPPTDDAYYRLIHLPSGEIRRAVQADMDNLPALPKGARIMRHGPLNSHGPSSNPKPFEFEGRRFKCNANRHWTVEPDPGLERVAKAEHMFRIGNDIAFKLFWDFNPAKHSTTCGSIHSQVDSTTRKFTWFRRRLRLLNAVC